MYALSQIIQYKKRMMSEAVQRGEIYKNYCPHPVRVKHVDADGGEWFTVFASEGKARLTEETEFVGMWGGVPLRKTSYGTIADLPEPRENVKLIVSMLVKDVGKAQGRTDLVSPDMGRSAVRNEKGEVDHVTGFLV